MSNSVDVALKIKEIDEKIDACIKNIDALFGGIENLDKDFELCFDEFTEEFFIALQKLLLFLQKKTAAAEFFLPHLSEFRRQNRLKLIDSPSSQGFSKEENSELFRSIETVWQSICLELNNHLHQALSVSYSPLTAVHNHFNLYLIKTYCNFFNSVYSPSSSWGKLKLFRVEYMKSFRCPCEPETSCYSCALKLCIQSVYEDHFLCCAGCFESHIVTYTEVLETYESVIQAKYEHLLQLVNSDVKSQKSLPADVMCLLSSRGEFQKNNKTCFDCYMKSSLHAQAESIMSRFQMNSENKLLWNQVFTLLIIKIIEVTSHFEDQVNILFNMGKEVNLHTHDDDIISLFEESKLILASDSPEESPLHEHSKSSESSPIKMSFLSNWRVSFVENGFLTHLQRSLQNEIEETIKTAIEKEKCLFQNGDWKDLVNWSRKDNFNSMTTHTYSLLDSVMNTILAFEKYAPVLKSATGVFQPFKNSMSHTIDAYVVDILKHLLYIAEEGCCIYFSYIAFNNAIFLKNHLTRYCEFIEGPNTHINEKCKNNVCNHAEKLVKELKEVLLASHFKYLVCSALFDADSCNFDDPKPFFEGERLSYCIQMWKLYMEGLQYDLSYFIPRLHAQELYGKVLSFSLDHFLIQYSKASPSHARHHQILIDIHAILLCTTELLFPACSYVTEYMGKKEELESQSASTISRIHSNCCCLLSILLVLTAPISEVHKVFGDAFPQPRLSDRTKYENVSPWLPWIQKELFSNLGQGSVMQNVSVWLAVKVCTSHIVPVPDAVVQAFTEQNCILSILLMTQAVSLESKCSSASGAVLEESRIRLAHNLSTLMLCCDNESYLLNIYFPVIEKADGWEEFDVVSINKAYSKRAWWYKGLYQAIKPFFISTFSGISSFWYEIKSKIQDPAALKHWMSIRDDLKNYVLCACPENLLNTMSDIFSLSPDIVSYLCIKNCIETLNSNIMFLPQPFKYFMACLEAHIFDFMPEIDVAENSIFIQLLISSTIIYFNEEEFVNKLPESVKDMASLTTNALAALCKGDDIILNNPFFKEKIQDLFATMQTQFDKEKKVFEEKKKPDNFDGLEKDILTLTTQMYVEECKGLEGIYFLHQLLCHNESWIKSNLGIPDLLSSEKVSSNISPSPLLRSTFSTPRECMPKETKTIFQAFPKKNYSDNPAFQLDEPFDSEESMEHTFTIPKDMLNLEAETKELDKPQLNLMADDEIVGKNYSFNPFQHFDKLGASSFSKVADEKPSLHWEALLSHLPILGLTEMNFKVLLKQRWDFADNSFLTEEDKKKIEDLKQLYELPE